MQPVRLRCGGRRPGQRGPGLGGRHGAAYLHEPPSSPLSRKPTSTNTLPRETTEIKATVYDRCKGVGRDSDECHGRGKFGPEVHNPSRRASVQQTGEFKLHVEVRDDDVSFGLDTITLSVQWNQDNRLSTEFTVDTGAPGRQFNRNLPHTYDASGSDTEFKIWLNAVDKHGGSIESILTVPRSAVILNPAPRTASALLPLAAPAPESAVPPAADASGSLRRAALRPRPGQGLHPAGLQGLHRPRRQVSQLQRTDGHAHQALHLVSQGMEHAADLPVPTLPQGDPVPGSALGFHLRRRRPDAPDVDPGSERGQFLLPRPAVQLDPVALLRRGSADPAGGRTIRRRR